MRLSSVLQLLGVLWCWAVSSCAQEIKPEDGKILVLGSRGLVGRALLKWLHAHNYEVLEVQNRNHIDLRVHHALEQFSSDKISFVFFFSV